MQDQDAVSPDASDERVVAGRYRLLSPLGAGGMGTVWRARDEMLRREVAVKEVRAPAGLPAAKVERMYTRLEREAWAAARITGRNVITVHDVVTDAGRPWIVMEFVRGRSLGELIASEGALTPWEAARIGAEVLAALRSAHEAGVLHRDVKPANVLLSQDERVILTDFGIAMVQGDTALTLTGEVVGSPEYLAPEQALGRTPGPPRTCGRSACCCTPPSRAARPSGARTPSARCGPSSTRSRPPRTGPGPSPPSSRDCCARTPPSGPPPSGWPSNCGSWRPGARSARTRRTRTRRHGRSPPAGTRRRTRPRPPSRRRTRG